MGQSSNIGPDAQPAPLQTWRAVLYYGLAPGLLAVLPALLPWLLVARAGWKGSLLGLRLPPLLCLAVAIAWARQVLVAAVDDLGRQADEGRLTDELGDRVSRGLTVAVWLLVVLLPLSMRRTHAVCEAWRFRFSSLTALARVDQAVREKQAEWTTEYGRGKAFLPEDKRLAPEQFGGPFRPPKRGAIGKLVIDKEDRVFYILDRPSQRGPGLSSQLWAVRNAVNSNKREKDPYRWSFERGLVHTPPGVALPEATQWGMPIRRLTPLRRGWSWYVAGEPAGRAE